MARATSSRRPRSRARSGGRCRRRAGTPSTSTSASCRSTAPGRVGSTFLADEPGRPIGWSASSCGPRRSSRPRGRAHPRHAGVRAAVQPRRPAARSVRFPAASACIVCAGNGSWGISTGPASARLVVDEIPGSVPGHPAGAGPSPLRHATAASKRGGRDGATRASRAEPVPAAVHAAAHRQRDRAQPDRLVRPRHGHGGRRLRDRPAHRLPGGAGGRWRRHDRRAGRGRPRERALHVACADGDRGRLHPRVSTPGRGGPRSRDGDRRPDLPRRARAHGIDGRHAARRPRAVRGPERAIPRHAPGDAHPAHRGDPGWLRVGGAPAPRRRARRGRGRGQPWLSARPVPQPAGQPANGPLRRQPGEPAALPARDDRRDPRRDRARADRRAAHLDRRDHAGGPDARRGPAGARDHRCRRAHRLRQRRRRDLGDARRLRPHRAADDGAQRLYGPARGAGEGRRIRAGHRGRSDQPAAGSRTRARARPGRRLRHDPSAHHGSTPPDEGGRGPHRRDPRLRRLQPGVHRALPRGLPDLVHPVPGERSRAASSAGASRRRPRAR